MLADYHTVTHATVTGSYYRKCRTYNNHQTAAHATVTCITEMYVAHATIIKMLHMQQVQVLQRCYTRSDYHTNAHTNAHMHTTSRLSDCYARNDSHTDAHIQQLSHLHTIIITVLHTQQLQVLQRCCTCSDYQIAAH